MKKCTHKTWQFNEVYDGKGHIKIEFIRCWDCHKVTRNMIEFGKEHEKRINEMYPNGVVKLC